MSETPIDSEKRAQLLQDGYCKFDGILPSPLVARLRSASDTLLDALPREQAEALRAQGSLLPTTGAPLFVELITLPAALNALASLGFLHPTFSDGYVISKPGHSPRLFWHYDWFAWQDPYSFGPNPPQLFAMYYLSDTSRENGCLRVIPGSHIRHNSLHDELHEPHSAILSQARDMSLPEFSTRSDEVDVPVKAGDLLIGDARLLHAAHTNETDERRTLITLWYQPDLRAMPEPIQAQMAAKVQNTPEWWPSEVKTKYDSLLATYDGPAQAYGRQLYCPKPAD
ncbi:MAG: phytanoyl-CoA dioxygenase family protein [Armatimonadota bacterium]|nr:phytanoyl-CoA dioxygenase family protein [Armatimonadota bacterium]